MDLTNKVVMRHADIKKNGEPTSESAYALMFYAPRLAEVAGKRRIVIYHSEQFRAKQTALLLLDTLSPFEARVQIDGELDELNSTDPLLRYVLKRPVREGVFEVYISHEEIIKMTLNVTDVPHCAMFGEGFTSL